jgi:hypothetical protein
MRDVILRVVHNNVTHDLDIDNNIPLRVDISSLENDKIGKIFGVGSQTFDLPGTKKNNIFFKNANDVGAIDTPGFFNFINAFVLLDGDIVLQGQMFLQEVITSDDGYLQYKVQIVDQSVDFKTELEGKFIANADWSLFNHTMSAETIEDSWADNLVGGNVFYPLCDFGNDGNIEYPTIPRIQVNGTATVITSVGSIDSGLTPMSLQQFQPAVSAKATFDVMFAQAGYNYTSSLVRSDGGPFYKLFVMPKTNDDLGPVFGGAIDNTFLAAYTASQPIAATPANTYANVTASFFDEINDPGTNYDPTTARYTAPVDGTYTLQMSVEYDSVGTPFPGVTFTLEAQVFNSSNTLVNIITFASRGAQGTGLSFVQSGTRQFTLNEGDYILPFVEWFNYNQSVSQPAFNIISGSNTFYNMTVAPTNYEGVSVDMADQWNADTKTSDVLEGFIEQFNLVLVPEFGLNKTIRVETFDSWMLEGKEVDWTQKYDTAKRISIKHPISEQNKTIQIGGAEDNDRFSKIAKESEPNLQYGTRQVISPSGIPLGTRKITSYFSPVILGSLIESGSVTEEGKPTFNLSGNSMFVPHLYKLGNSAQETFAFKPRLGYKIDDVSCGPAYNGIIYYGDIGGTTNSTSTYSTLGNISTIDLNADIIYNLHYDTQYVDYTAIGGPYQQAEAVSQTNYDLYWSNYIEGLYDEEARKITLDLLFTPEEYKDIRLNDIILIKNQKYRINKISGFNLMYPDIVTAELIKEYPKYNNVTDIVPIPPPEPPPVYTGSLDNGWAFKAQTAPNNDQIVGYQQGNYAGFLPDTSSLIYGTGSAPTTDLIGVGNWISSGIVLPVSGGQALVGTGSADDLGLLSFRSVTGNFYTGDYWIMEITSASADPALESPAPPTGSGQPPLELTGRVVDTTTGLFSTWTGSFLSSLTSSGSPYNPTAINYSGSSINFFQNVIGFTDIQGSVDELIDGRVYYVLLEGRS